MRRWYSIGIITMATFVLAPGLVQAGSGFYFSSEMGANFAPGMDMKEPATTGPVSATSSSTRGLVKKIDALARRSADGGVTWTGPKAF